MPTMNNLEKAMMTGGMPTDTRITGPPSVAFMSKDVQTPRPPCDCVACYQQWRSFKGPILINLVYVNIVPDEQAARLLTCYVERIKSEQEWLRKTLQAHGDKILTHWARGDRSKFLSQALPALQSGSFADLRFNYSGMDWRITRQQHRATYLLPYFNKETLLSDPNKFLSMLHNRTYYDFRDFVMIDKQLQHMGFFNGALGIDYNAHCVDMSPTSNYGKLVPFSPSTAHTWLAVGYPRAEIIIDSQLTLYINLRKIVDVILSEVSNLPISKSNQWKQFIGNGCRLKPSDIVSNYLDRAFAAPPRLDTDRFCDLASTRRKEAEDHLWLLQTDPAYLYIACLNFKNTKLYAKASKERATRLLAAEVANTPRKRARIWRNIDEECCNVRDVYRRFQDGIHVTSPNPPKYERALCALELMLVNQCLELGKDLTRLLRLSPGFEKHFAVVSTADGRPGSILKNPAKGGDVNVTYFRKDPLFWCMMQLTGDVEDPHMIDHNILFNFLEAHLQKADARERARIDQRLYDLISDMAAVYELLSTLRMLRPLHRADEFSFDDAGRLEKARSYWRIVENKLPELKDSQLNDLGKDLARFVNIGLPPSNLGSAKAWLTAAESRQASIDFWVRVQDFSKTVLAKKSEILDIDKESEMAMISHATSKEHFAMLEHEKRRYNEILGLATPKTIIAKAASNNSDTSSLQTHWGDGSDDQDKVAKFALSKDKPKTRPVEPSHENSTEPHEIAALTGPAADDGASMPSAISVRRSSLNIFSKAFPEKGYEGNGKTRWQDFVVAMADAGFVAKTSGGSAVTFEDNEADRGKIVIHRPHPESEIGHVVLRCIGKRLKKWFGWTKECFTVEK